MRLLLVLALLFIAACDCDVCDDRSGSYLVTYSESTGDCGSLPTVLVEVSASYELPPSCSGGSTLSEDNCSISLDISCTDVPTGTVLTQRGSFDWDCDGDEATGELETSILSANPTETCASLYVVTYGRQ